MIVGSLKLLMAHLKNLKEYNGFLKQNSWLKSNLIPFSINGLTLIELIHKKYKLILALNVITKQTKFGREKKS